MRRNPGEAIPHYAFGSMRGTRRTTDKAGLLRCARNDTLGP